MPYRSALLRYGNVIGAAEAVPYRFSLLRYGNVIGAAKAVPYRSALIRYGNVIGAAEAVPYRSSLILALALLLGFVSTGCGYHTVGAATHIPANVRTLAVPIFQSRVQAYHTETAFTEAVVRELNTRTRYRVLPVASGSPDAILKGTIVAQTITPLTYDPSSGQTSSYLVSITASVELVGQDGTVLYRNDAFAWHEQYQSTQDLSGFVQEDGPAMQRVARVFAQAVVSDMLESFR